jgi:hypothetical protein
LAIIIEEKGKEMAYVDTRVLAFVRGGKNEGSTTQKEVAGTKTVKNPMHLKNLSFKFAPK